MEEKFEREDLEVCLMDATYDFFKAKGYNLRDTQDFRWELVQKIIFELEFANFIRLKIEEEEEEEKEYGTYHHDEELGETYIY